MLLDKFSIFFSWDFSNLFQFKSIVSISWYYILYTVSFYDTYSSNLNISVSGEAGNGFNIISLIYIIFILYYFSTNSKMLVLLGAGQNYTKSSLLVYTHVSWRSSDKESQQVFIPLQNKDFWIIFAFQFVFETKHIYSLTRHSEARTIVSILLHIS